MMLGDSQGMVIQVENAEVWNLGAFYEKNHLKPSRHKLYIIMDEEVNCTWWSDMQDYINWCLFSPFLVYIRSQHPSQTLSLTLSLHVNLVCYMCIAYTYKYVYRYIILCRLLSSINWSSHPRMLWMSGGVLHICAKYKVPHAWRHMGDIQWTPTFVS